jgi:hypothetical protein
MVYIANKTVLEISLFISFTSNASFLPYVVAKNGLSML